MHHLLLPLRVVGKEGRGDDEVRITGQGVSDDPVCLDRINVQVLAEVWREKAKKLEDIAVTDPHGNALDSPTKLKLRVVTHLFDVI